MPTDNTTILAAWIAALTALFTVAINVVSSQVSHLRSRGEKHREWLRDKQVRDAEEIVPALSGFLKEMVDSIESFDAHQKSAYSNIYTLYDVRKKGLPLEDFQVIVSFLEDFLKEYWKDAETLWELRAKLTTWFRVDSKRLSIWFDEANYVEPALDEIGTQILTFELLLHRKSSEFAQFVGELKDANFKVTEENISRVESLTSEFSSVVSQWSEVNAFMLAFQKKLANKFKPLTFEAQVNPSKDGFLVHLARQVERGVGWAFRSRP